MLPSSLITELKRSKNLLAFSAGGDSCALFFLLLEAKIPFDIAIVDYGLREQSKDEVAYAKELAQRYNKRCFIKSIKLPNKNFEANARKSRYSFFEELIATYNYDTLLTAHHLGDRLEWFLMQLCKGAGCLELGGMRMIEQRDHYMLLRPLLNYDKEDLENYLAKNGIKYFHDKSNDDESILRNRFRHRFAKPLLKEYKEGICRSFRYLDEDRTLLEEECPISKEGEMSCITKTSSPRATLLCIDKELKKRGYLLSAFEKEQLKREENTIVGRKYLIVFYKNLICITPYSDTKPSLPKKFKEECRRLSIEPKLRPFFYSNQKAFELFKNLAQAT